MSDHFTALQNKGLINDKRARNKGNSNPSISTTMLKVKISNSLIVNVNDYWVLKLFGQNGNLNIFKRMKQYEDRESDKITAHCISV